MPVNAMNNTVQTLDVDNGESTSKLVKWSLANWHFSETTVIRVRSRANTIKDVAKANSMKSQDSDSQVPKQQTLNRKSLKTAESLISAKDKWASKINAHARGPRVACVYFARSIISRRSWKLFTDHLVCENAEEIWIRRLSKTLPFNKVRLWTHQDIAEILKLHFLRNTAAVSSLFSMSAMPG